MTLKIQDRPVIAMLYVVALLIVVDQTLDWLGLILPFRAGLTTWRFGAFGLGLGKLSALAFADALLISAALLLEHRRALFALGIAHALVALFLGLGLGMFLLDGLELRSSVTPERKREVMVAAGRTALTAGLSFLACVTITIGLIRSHREHVKRETQRRSEAYLAGPAGSRADG